MPVDCVKQPNKLPTPSTKIASICGIRSSTLQLRLSASSNIHFANVQITTIVFNRRTANTPNIETSVEHITVTIITKAGKAADRRLNKELTVLMAAVSVCKSVKIMLSTCERMPLSRPAPDKRLVAEVNRSFTVLIAPAAPLTALVALPTAPVAPLTAPATPPVAPVNAPRSPVAPAAPPGRDVAVPEINYPISQCYAMMSYFKISGHINSMQNVTQEIIVA